MTRCFRKFVSVCQWRALSPVRPLHPLTPQRITMYLGLGFTPLGHNLPWLSPITLFMHTSAKLFPRILNYRPWPKGVFGNEQYGDLYPDPCPECPQPESIFGNEQNLMMVGPQPYANYSSSLVMNKSSIVYLVGPQH